MEEQLLAALLAANAELLEALKQWDDLNRVAIERKVEDRSKREVRMDRRVSLRFLLWKKVSDQSVYLAPGFSERCFTGQQHRRWIFKDTIAILSTSLAHARSYQSNQLSSSNNGATYSSTTSPAVVRIGHRHKFAQPEPCSPTCCSSWPTLSNTDFTAFKDTLAAYT